jgi:hypothetical protein
MPKGSLRVNVGFQHDRRKLLGFELKITHKADIYMLVFEKGHRRLHISYHSNGRVHYKADRPNRDAVYVKSDYLTGRMEPIIKREIPPKDVVGRQKVAVTGWGMADVEAAALNEFDPGHEDVLICQPDAMSLGFCVNIVGPKAIARSTGEVGSPILERRYVDGIVRLEIEVFDWLTD